jgi:hypothetical protein
MCTENRTLRSLTSEAVAVFALLCLVFSTTGHNA